MEKEVKTKIVELFQSLPSKSKLAIELYQMIQLFHSSLSSVETEDLVEKINNALVVPSNKDTPVLAWIRGLTDFMQLA